MRSVAGEGRSARALMLPGGLHGQRLARVCGSQLLRDGEQPFQQPQPQRIGQLRQRNPVPLRHRVGEVGADHDAGDVGHHQQRPIAQRAGMEQQLAMGGVEVAALLPRVRQKCVDLCRARVRRPAVRCPGRHGSASHVAPARATEPRRVPALTHSLGFDSDAEGRWQKRHASKGWLLVGERPGLLCQEDLAGLISDQLN